tara:strand:+ start:1117 stop:1662 length:546 start_codon:yes stop_codon:yes gene_type:complete
VRWVSPLAEDNYAEYRDAAFLDRLGLQTLAPDLQVFWPARGPQWDALGVFDDGVVLVEAKAHIREFFSPATTADGRSLEQIRAAFALTQASLDVSEKAAWETIFYQYANRIAHLDFLRRNKVNAHLIFVDFLGDRDMKRPASSEIWEAAFQTGGFCDVPAEAPQVEPLHPSCLSGYLGNRR